MGILIHIGMALIHVSFPPPHIMHICAPSSRKRVQEVLKSMLGVCHILHWEAQKKCKKLHWELNKVLLQIRKWAGEYSGSTVFVLICNSYWSAVRTFLIAPLLDEDGLLYSYVDRCGFLHDIYACMALLPFKCGFPHPCRYDPHLCNYGPFNLEVMAFPLLHIYMG